MGETVVKAGDKSASQKGMSSSETKENNGGFTRPDSQLELRADLQALMNELKALRESLGGVKEDVGAILQRVKNEVEQFKEDLGELKKEVGESNRMLTTTKSKFINCWLPLKPDQNRATLYMSTYNAVL